MLFEDSDMNCVVILHFKNKSSAQQNSVYKLQWIHIKRNYINQSGGGGEVGPVYRHVLGFRGLTA